MTSTARPTPAVQLSTACADPSCPCRNPRAFGQGHMIWAGDRYDYVQVEPDVRGLGMTEERLARSLFFRWMRVA